MKISLKIKIATEDRDFMRMESNDMSIDEYLQALKAVEATIQIIKDRQNDNA